MADEEGVMDRVPLWANGDVPDGVGDFVSGFLY